MNKNQQNIDEILIAHMDVKKKIYDPIKLMNFDK